MITPVYPYKCKHMLFQYLFFQLQKISLDI